MFEIIFDKRKMVNDHFQGLIDYPSLVHAHNGKPAKYLTTSVPPQTQVAQFLQP